MKAEIPVMYEVRRSFPAARAVRVGDVVDASRWRNRALLERQGYIVPVEQKTEKIDKAEKVEQKTGKAEEPKPEKVTQPVKAEEAKPAPAKSKMKKKS